MRYSNALSCVSFQTAETHAADQKFFVPRKLILRILSSLLYVTWIIYIRINWRKCKYDHYLIN